MNNRNKSRTISVSDTSLLITNAGGRCSYNKEQSYCNKVLSDGRVNLGERAHIIGVNGPRANTFFDGNANGYDNLMWLCRDHHKIIDHSENIEKYSVEVLREMKARHEQRIKTGRYPYYGTTQSLHDYGVLSCLFEFINIHTLYSYAASYPEVNLDFFNVSDMCSEYRQSNPGYLPLKDPILNFAFSRFERSHYDLASILNHDTVIKEDSYSHMSIYTWRRSVRGENSVLRYLSSVEYLISLIEKRFPQILHQEIYEAFPQYT